MVAIAVLSTALTGSLLAAPRASADFDNHGRFIVEVPDLLCEIATGGLEAVCQGVFPLAPPITYCGQSDRPCTTSMRQDQAVATSGGHIEYRDANIGVGDGPTLNALAPGQTETVRGWSITDSEDGVSLINSGTGHGMKIHDDGTVEPI
jgi:hypothetical protein